MLSIKIADNCDEVKLFTTAAAAVCTIYNKCIVAYIIGICVVVDFALNCECFQFHAHTLIK